ncbi:MAG: hypothetical protein ACTSX6_02520 [Candidatus Heimdallarchaeaceae archaeon]
MGTLNVEINEELDKLFRSTVSERMGMKKGNLTNALEEALRNWINEPETEKFKRIAINSDSTDVREKARESLEMLGNMDAVKALADVANSEKIYSRERKDALERAQRIISKLKRENLEAIETL